MIRTTGIVFFVIGALFTALFLLRNVAAGLAFVLLMLGGAFLYYISRSPDWRGTIERVRIGMAEKFGPALGSTNTALVLRKLRSIVRIALFSFLTFAVLVVVLFVVQRNSGKEDKTRNECQEIVHSLAEYKAHYKQYPPSLDALIGNNPLRSEWHTDEWRNQYIYQPSPDGQSFSLVSKGDDGKPNTKDDLKFAGK